MPPRIDIVPYEPAHEPAVKAFNQRLREGGEGEFQLAESVSDNPYPPGRNRRLYLDRFVAVEAGPEAGAVRGGYTLKHQAFRLHGEEVAVGNLQLPLSEGVIDRRYVRLGMRLVRDALRKQPLIYCLGMGGLDRSFPRLLEAAGWTLRPVPFLFRVARPFGFLRGIAHLRRRPAARLACDLAAFSGLGWLGFRAVACARPPPRPKGLSWERVEAFSGWTEGCWERVGETALFQAVRDHDTLRLLYPESDRRFIRLRVRRDGEDIGWAVLLCTAMDGHKQFGNLRVGTLVDGLARPGREVEVAAAATHELLAAGADLLISNQSHRYWVSALRRCGYLPGPSNFVLALSPALAEGAGSLDPRLEHLHFNRGDGDGPIHL